MNKILRLLPFVLYASLLVYAGCSGSDEPKPFDCARTDLAISLATNGDVDPTSCTSNDGSITVAATGGKEPYTFAVGTGSFGSSASFTGLGAGTFSITVKDANNCTKDIDVSLTAPGVPTVTIEKTEDTNCTSPGNGTITVDASGGTGPYTYKLDGGAFVSNPLFENVRSGSHTVVVKDNEACTITISTTVDKGVTGIDYVNDILPILESKCNFPGCHPDNGDWFTYSVAKTNAANIKSQTGSGKMPKGGSSAPNGALSASQIAKIACWVDDGAPEN
ncbi:MAG TPA: SprB repeat-containing protein [Cyclobacteriaceae bacterium]|nr:SprB repeat-containing protein [Cyclobacteriaceae bacterium]HMV09823.1 SprB repeat-containing protein [Cyclobacteriaceae bacterium]HMV89573.1 SprB repeat-containing protein [Cyclobacteriaceae bacterium]HMX00468.1 SprB repeat-containing protein [Cyclobacteriaceae bacterium]HMX50448.1 SprB repeat-containing protein [Cyclobacteriaceae bacterium]